MILASAFTLEKPGISVWQDRISLGQSGGKPVTTPVQNQTRSVFPGKRLISTALGYRMKRATVTFDNGQGFVRAIEPGKDKPTHALVLVNPVAKLLSWSKVEIELSPGVTVLASAVDFRGQVCAQLVLAPIDAEIQWTVHAFPVESTIAPGLGTQIYVPFEDIVSHSRLKVEQEGQVRLIFTGKA